MKIMITGANGHLGIRLMRALNASRPVDDVIALVRSERAAAAVRDAGVAADVRIVDYRNAGDLAAAGRGCDALVNLVGIIKETRANTFRMAHEDTSQAIRDADLDVSQVVSLSIVGSDTGSANTCLASRAAADDILLAGDIPATILRVPMVLGPGDYASMALAKNGRSRVCFTFRAGSLEQPIFSEDVVTAILAALRLPAAHRVIELAGPESLDRRSLIARAGRLFNRSPIVLSLPIGLGYLIAGIMELVSGSPPVTRAMLGVLDHDDAVDPGPALATLKMSLTPLDETLERVCS